MAEVFSVEVFRDRSSGRITVEDALAGVALVNDIAERFEVVAANQRIGVGRSGTDNADFRRLELNKLDCDVNIILTDRKLGSRRGHAARALTMVALDNLPTPVVIASTTYDNLGYAVAHELAHCLDVRTEKSADPMHCDQPGCLLGVYMDTLMSIKSERRSPIGQRMIKMGLLGQKMQTEEIICNDRFCNACAVQIASNPHLLTYADLEKITPDGVIGVNE